MSLLDLKNRPAKAMPSKSLLWTHYLVEFDYETNNAKVIRSFISHAKESDIQFSQKKKKPAKPTAPKIESTEETVQKEALFN